jgi:plasmid replication initiation protein
MSRIKKLKAKETDVVVQSNSLIEASKTLNLLEYKLFMLVLSKINPDSQDLPVFTITAEEFSKVLGAKTINFAYRDLQKAADRLMTRTAMVYYPERNLTIKTNLTSKALYWHNKGCIEIHLSNDIKPFILNLRREFTQYKLTNITKLSSVYAIRLYELLKSHESLQTRTFDILALREKLGIPKQLYTRFADFRIRVLSIAQREINTKTDIHIDITFKKTKQKITSVVFSITQTSTKQNQKDMLVSVKKVMNMGYSLIESVDISNKTEGETFINAVDAVTEQIEKGNSKRPKAMLQTAIEKKWKPSKKKSTVKKIKTTKVKKSYVSKLLNFFDFKK